MYLQDEIKFWIAGATGNAGTSVDPGVCASIARAMIDYNRMYANSFLLDTQINVPEEFTGRHEGAEVDKDVVFQLEDCGRVISPFMESFLSNSWEHIALSLDNIEKNMNKIIWMILGTWLAILAMVVGAYTILNSLLI